MIRMRLLLMPWVGPCQHFRHAAKIVPLFSVSAIHRSPSPRCVWVITHENAYCRKTPVASQPLERQELQTPPIRAASVGTEAAGDGELVVNAGRLHRFWQFFLEREREPITFAGPDSASLAQW